MDKYWVDMLTFKSEMNYKGYKPSTMKSYISTIRDFLAFTEKPTEKIRKSDADKFIKFNRKRVTENTIHVKEKAIELFFKHVLGFEIMFEKVKRDYTRREFMTEQEVASVINNAVGKYSLIFREMYFQGRSVKELSEEFNLSVRRIQSVFVETAEKIGLQADTGSLKYSRVYHLLLKGDRQEALAIYGGDSFRRIRRYFKDKGMWNEADDTVIPQSDIKTIKKSKGRPRGPVKIEVKTVVRRCLKCHAEFKSEIDNAGMAFYRTCPKCRTENAGLTRYNKLARVL